jgi:PAP2 superfamily
MNVFRAGACARRDDGELNASTGEGGFPACAWTSPFSTMHLDNPRIRLFEPGALSLDPPPADVADQCCELLRKQHERTPDRVADIEDQAASEASVLRPLRKVLGLLPYFGRANPRRELLIRDIGANIEQQTFIWKRRYMRARPVHLCPLITPLFPWGHEHYPGHPSYPSGHATKAFAWAHLMKAKLSPRHAHLGQSLVDAALGVAENREWAGVHFASDTRAGQDLGSQMALAMLNHGGQDRLTDEQFQVLMPGLT